MKKTKNIKNNILLSHFGISIVLLFYFFLLGTKIILYPTPFYDWDEGIYATVGREMIRNKSFLYPLWQGMPWLDKPPLPPLIYGLSQLIPVSPEISTRMVTLLLSCTVLIFLYQFTYRITKSKWVSTLTVCITAFIPGFFQRSQALNVDVFLMLGWLGYVLYYQNTAVSTFFLLVAVLSKSLLGLYPVFMFFSFNTLLLLTKKIKIKEYILFLKSIALQFIIASAWFIGMYIAFGNEFIKNHFLESHFKRVTASIEQHFGQRTFYLDILIDQFKWLIIPSCISIAYLIYIFFKKEKQREYAFFSLFFVPWFIFLNLTKTKIAWYIYPVLPQFAFLISYSLLFFRKKMLSMILYFGLTIILLFIFVSPPTFIWNSSYSQWEDHQLIAKQAHNLKCGVVFVLVGENTRSSYKTLKDMNLVITTTTWWGNHPSIAYYTDAKTYFLYTLKEAKQLMDDPNLNECFIIEKNDITSLDSAKKLGDIGHNNTYILLRKRP